MKRIMNSFGHLDNLILMVNLTNLEIATCGMHCIDCIHYMYDENFK